MNTSFGQNFRRDMGDRDLISFIGAYDVFSASIAARYYDGIFLSGFSFAASFYGLPDIGFIAWSDIVSFAHRVRAVLPTSHILVDIDDGYADVEVACHVVSLLEHLGISGVILEDQKRPRMCGHYDGKQLMDLDDFTLKLKRVLDTRRDMIVIARTDASESDEIFKRASAFSAAGADAILVDGLKDVDLIRSLRSLVPQPLVFNQIAGGKSPRMNARQLKEAGVSLVIYSTPCLFAAQGAVDAALRALRESDGILARPGDGQVDVKSCTSLLKENLELRDRLS